LTPTAGSPPSSRPAIDPAAPAILTIDLAALCDNYKTLKARAPGAECAAVVKADAYGTGAARAVNALAQAGCGTFFVATLEEARRIQGSAEGATLYVLDGLFPDAAPAFAEIDARPVLGSLQEVEEWAGYCTATGTKRPAAIHIDTGMNRLGLTAHDVETLGQKRQDLAAFTPVLVMSHLACGDNPDDPMNEDQRAAFDRLRQKLPPAPACLANSAGVFLGERFHYDMVRPGVSLYGGRAVTGAPNPMKPVVRLDVRIVQIRDAEAGESVGYGAARNLIRRTRIATAAAGYADGLFRHLSAGDGETGLTAYIGDYPLPILGRVSMDSITLDITDLPDDLVRRGTLVELLGGHIGVDDLAEKAGTIGYEVLTSLGHRYQRIYLEPGSQG